MVTVPAAHAHAQEAVAKASGGESKLLDPRVAIALFIIVAICLLLSLLIWRMAKSKAKGEKDTGGKRFLTKTWKLSGYLMGFGL
jgi:hypothetical protein